jgi:uncharacterized Zn-binding protein involved in type VI secretion
MAGIAVAGDTNVHGGAPLNTGLSGNVSAGNKGVATVGSSSSLNDDQYNANRRSHPQGVAGNQVATGGSGTVFVNSKAVHRKGDARIDGATAGPGVDTVDVG